MRSWRRQIRLDAYYKFLEAEHQFHNSMMAAFDAYGHESFSEKMLKFTDAVLLIGRAGSLVSIAGPVSMADLAQQVIDTTRVILADTSDAAAMAKAAAEIRKLRKYGNLVKFITATETFETAARRVLKTEKVTRPLSLRR